MKVNTETSGYSTFSDAVKAQDERIRQAKLRKANECIECGEQIGTNLCGITEDGLLCITCKLERDPEAVEAFDHPNVALSVVSR
jgi:formylmethanofuran dehydrogenase subunit E